MSFVGRFWKVEEDRECRCEEHQSDAKYVEVAEGSGILHKIHSYPNSDTIATGCVPNYHSQCWIEGVVTIGGAILITNRDSCMIKMVGKFYLYYSY